MPSAKSSTVALYFASSRAADGEDIAALLRAGLGEEAAIEAVLSEEGALTGYRLHMTFPSPEVAFDAALAIRNFMASEGWPCEIS